MSGGVVWVPLTPERRRSWRVLKCYTHSADIGGHVVFRSGTRLHMQLPDFNVTAWPKAGQSFDDAARALVRRHGGPT